jgi:branched-subunit amino acid transport protein AzlD
MGFLPILSESAPKGRTVSVLVNANIVATSPISVFEAPKSAAMVGNMGNIMPNPMTLMKIAKQISNMFLFSGKNDAILSLALPIIGVYVFQVS